MRRSSMVHHHLQRRRRRRSTATPSPPPSRLLLRLARLPLPLPHPTFRLLASIPSSLPMHSSPPPFHSSLLPSPSTVSLCLPLSATTRATEPPLPRPPDLPQISTSPLNPSLHFLSPPHLPFLPPRSLPLRSTTQPRPWERHQRRRFPPIRSDAISRRRASV
jgi:hypothetical protein